MNPLSAIDATFSKVSTYRFVYRSLALLAASTVAGAFFGWFPYTPAQLVVSLILLWYVCVITNKVCVLLTHAPATRESSLITALILFFIIAPPQNGHDAVVIMLVAALASASKYGLALRSRHFFNPAAVALVLASIFVPTLVQWWILQPVELFLILAVGLFVIRKSRTGKVFFYFLLAALVSAVSYALIVNATPAAVVQHLVFASPLLFFGLFMLSDPHTMPVRMTERRYYAIGIGVFFGLAVCTAAPPSILFLPLLLGNLYAYRTHLLKRSTLTFHTVRKLTQSMYEYSFLATTPVVFIPGQHAEWSAPHRKPDERGIRRHLTFSSSPQDAFVRIAVTLPVESSTFKDVLKELKKGQVLTLSSIAGDFILPQDPTCALGAIAGGIGIVPFMSMMRWLADTHQRRNLVLIYAATSPLEFSYKDEIDAIKDAIGVRVIYLPADYTEVVGWRGASGALDAALLEQEVRDYRIREWYVAGPEALVPQYVQFLRGMDISRKAIHQEQY
jgi:ferredoxin-NADP reductase